MLSADGLGQLKIGSPLPMDPKSIAVAVYDSKACVSSETGVKAGSAQAGVWEPNYKAARSLKHGVFTLTTGTPAKNKPLYAAQVWTSQIATEAGIKVGSSEAAVRAAYPSATVTTQSPAISTVYMIKGEKGYLDIEVAEGKGQWAHYWPEGQVGHVLWMTATANPTTRGIAGSDGVGNCPTGD